MKLHLLRHATYMLCYCVYFSTIGMVAAAERERQALGRIEKHQRQVIVCVDGVGYSTMMKLRAEGRFKFMSEPSRMIAPFPTLTNISLAKILAPAGADVAVGYEDNYFDVKANHMSGGILARFNQAEFVDGSYRRLFDYHPSALKSGAGYVAPPLSTYIESMTDVFMIRRKLRGASQPVYLAYSGSTDSLAHLGGEGMVLRFMRKLDDLLAELIRDTHGNIEITIFSDHGNEYRNYQRVELHAAIRSAGFHTANVIKDADTVVIPQFGLLGCAALYTLDQSRARAARAAVTAKGVDFAAFEQDGEVHVVGNAGEATIARQGTKFRYRVVTGDPLQLTEVSERLAQQGLTDAEGFCEDADWFEATKSGYRPDAVRRVYDGLTGLVQNRASVLVSFQDGYYSGNRAMDVVAFLQAAHGNLTAAQSNGFVVSSTRPLAPYVRAGDVWQAIGSPQLMKSPVATAQFSESK